MDNVNSVYWIIARIGGFDGVSMQSFEYMKLLNQLGITVNIITGLEQTEFGTIEYGQNQRFLIERLNFKHPDSVFLYKNSLTNKDEDPNIYHKKKIEWKKIFERHKNGIKKAIKEILLKEKNIPVFVHNLISLRHMHPAAAVAIKEIIEEHPDMVFVNFAPDSDWERFGRLEMVRDYVRKTISSGSVDSSGPYVYDNLHHLVLNNYQKEVFIQGYRVPSKQVFEIPDFLDFESPEFKMLDPPEEGFLDYLAENSMYLKDGEIGYKKCTISKDTIFFLCPVRPVNRKKLKASIFLAHQFKINTGKKVSVILTHSKEDNVDYFEKCVLFANDLRMNLIFLGDSLKLSNKKEEGVWTLNDVYKNMAALNSIGLVTSNSGGWENAINELLKEGIPLIVNPELESYAQITENMKIDILGLPLTGCHELIRKFKGKGLGSFNMKGILSINKFISWVEKYCIAHSDKRKELVRHNYKQAYLNLSSESKKPDVIKLLHAISKR